jgi:MSHA biogenesis protein MshJ
MITKQTWDHWVTNVAARNRRERMLITLVGVFLIGMAFYSYVWSPLLAQWSLGQQQERLLAQQSQELSAAITSLTQASQQDPNLPLREKLQVVNKRLAQLNSSLSDQMATLIPAGEMAATLQQILAQSGRLQLESLTSLKPEPILAEQSDFNFYRHGVRLVLRGQFADIYAYLVQLESLPQHFYWQTLNYKVAKYPDAVVEVTIFTLSNNKEFIRG